MSVVSTRDTASSSGSASLVWITAVGCLLPVFALFVTGRGTLLRLAIPAAAFLVGLALYYRRPIGYFHYTLWAWFLTPLVRRLVDFRVDFEDHNFVLLAPFLVSAISGLTLLRERRQSRELRLSPFFLCLAGVFYGFVVGLVRFRLHVSEVKSAGEVIYGLFTWISPLFFGLHLYLRWPLYQEHKRALQKTLLWAVLLTGIYGVVQFVSPLPWDGFWLEHMISDVGAESFGRPEPFQVRVFSTLNSPGVFANVLMVGLLVMFCVRSRLKPFATAAGYSAFLLTLVRTSWLGWLVGLVVLARNSGGKQITRLLFSMALLPVLISPLMLNPDIATVVTDRLQTFHDTKNDESYQDRAEEYRVLLANLAVDPFGEGVSNAETWHGYTMDSGVILIFYYCGWIGAALFLAGIVTCTLDMPTGKETDDPFAPAYRAAVIAIIFEMLSGNMFTGPSGAMIWTCVGLGLGLRELEKNAFAKEHPEPLVSPGLAVPNLVA
jgi:hypothetical protein